MTPYEPVGWDEARKAQAKRFFPALLVVLGVIAVGVLGLSPGPACACTPTQPPVPTSPVDGVVIAVDSPSLGQVNGFVLRLPDATTLTLTIGPLENATQFSPTHLTEHMATSQAVRAFFVLKDGVPIVYRLEDAPA